MEGGSSKGSKSGSKDHSGSPARSSRKQKPKSPEHNSPEHKLWQAKEQVLNMPSPRREFREGKSATDPQVVCCGPDKKGETFSRMAVLYFMFFSCVFVLAIVGLRMFTIEDKLLRLDTDYQQQQMRIEALEEKILQLTKSSVQKRSSDGGGGSEIREIFKRRRRETAECICPPGKV